MFEAGALSKNIDKSKVCPILFGVDPSDIKGPLVQFQAAKFNKEEIKKVVRMVNSELESNSLTSEVFESVFEMWWPKLSERIENELNKAKKTNGKELRSERDILEEILSLSRNISIRRDREMNNHVSISPNAVQDSVNSFFSLVDTVFDNDLVSIEIVENLQNMLEPLRYMSEKSESSGISRRNNSNRFEEITIRLNEIRLISARPKRIVRRVVEDKSTEN